MTDATPESQAHARSRRTFWPLALLGIGSAVLAAVASSKPMMKLDPSSLADVGLPASALERFQDGGPGDLRIAGATNEVAAGDLPLAAALALVLLACWGVLLVTRGRFRLVVALLALVASAGLLVSLVAGYLLGTEDYVDAFARALGVESLMEDKLGVQPTGWFWTAVVAAVVAALVSVVALRHVRHWPAMGSQYDAPGGGAKGGPVRPETATTNELWKSIDEGHDPTEEPKP